MTEEMFTPEEDVTERRGEVDVLVAPKGIPIPLERAKQLGIYKEPKQTKPKETKKDEEPK
jgi:hypothetical protein